MPYISLIKRKPFALWMVIFSGLLLPVPVLVIGGCGRELQGMPGGNGQPGALSIPPSGFMRMVSRQIQEKPLTTQTGPATKADGESLHYKWSIIGERNWRNPKADKNGFTLGDVYPLNSTTNRGGCNIWECDLTAQTLPDAAQSKPTTVVGWHLTIHGSNGQTAQAEGIVSQPSLGHVEDSVQVVQTRDEPTSLPSDVLLARIGTNEVRLRVAK